MRSILRVSVFMIAHGASEALVCYLEDCYGYSQRQAVSHYQSRWFDERHPDGRAAEGRRRQQVPFGSRPAVRLEGFPGSAAEAVQDPRRTAEAEEGKVASSSASGTT